MSVKLLTGHHFKFPSIKGGCTGSSESTLVKIPHCWQSHNTAHIVFSLIRTSSAVPAQVHTEYIMGWSCKKITLCTSLVVHV